MEGVLDPHPTSGIWDPFFPPPLCFALASPSVPRVLFLSDPSAPPFRTRMPPPFEPGFQTRGGASHQLGPIRCWRRDLHFASRTFSSCTRRIAGFGGAWKRGGCVGRFLEAPRDAWRGTRGRFVGSRTWMRRRGWTSAMPKHAQDLGRRPRIGAGGGGIDAVGMKKEAHDRDLRREGRPFRWREADWETFGGCRHDLDRTQEDREGEGAGTRRVRRIRCTGASRDLAGSAGRRRCPRRRPMRRNPR